MPPGANTLSRAAKVQKGIGRRESPGAPSVRPSPLRALVRTPSPARVGLDENVSAGQVETSGAGAAWLDRSMHLKVQSLVVVCTEQTPQTPQYGDLPSLRFGVHLLRLPVSVLLSLSLHEQSLSVPWRPSRGNQPQSGPSKPHQDDADLQCQIKEALGRAAAAEAIVASKDSQIEQMIVDLEEATANSVREQQAIQAEHEEEMNKLLRVIQEHKRQRARAARTRKTPTGRACCWGLEEGAAA